MSFDTNDALDARDATDTNTDADENPTFSPSVQQAMSEGLDDFDLQTDNNTAQETPASAPPEPTSTPNAPAPNDPDDQWATAYPHIGGKIEADYNKEAEGTPVKISGDEDQETGLEPPEGYSPGGPEGGW